MEAKPMQKILVEKNRHRESELAKPFSMNRFISPRFLLLFLLVGYFTLSVIPGFRTNFETSDGYDFMVESRRAQKTLFPATINWERPRAFVAVLMAVDRVSVALTGHEASLNEIHIFMCLITLSFFLAWYFILAQMVDPWAALGSIFLMMNYRALFKSSFLCLSDIFTGLFFAISLALCFGLMKALKAGAPTTLRRILLAFSLTLVALGKHQVFIFVPLFMAVSLTAFLFYSLSHFSIKKALGWFVDAMLVWAVSVEALLRLTTAGEESALTYVKYLYERTRWALGVPDFTPKTTYLVEFYDSYGAVFLLVVSLLLIGFGYRRIKNKVETGEGIHRPLLFIAVLASLAGLALNERCPNREPRYLIPFLPVVFALISMEVITVGRNLASSRRWTFAIAVFAVLVYPLQSTIRNITEVWNIADSNVNRHEVSEFWNFLNRSEQGRSCRRLMTCSSWSYDGGPGAYILNARLSPWFQYCPVDGNRNVSQLFDMDREVGDCYILPGSRYPGRRVEKLVSKGPETYVQQTFFE
jgi:hypothetical protein